MKKKKFKAKLPKITRVICYGVLSGCVPLNDPGHGSVWHESTDDVTDLKPGTLVSYIDVNVKTGVAYTYSDVYQPLGYYET